ncbi:MAG: Gfo/Idh/MocA family oxidoreductase [Candidatus Omnitrophica bacterium]|nr:Gfo/Idh/MocA family oxidoreductase [Candidatus Omnitrophota bacterium]
MVRLGLIGAGRWGQVYLRTIAKLEARCRLSHLCTSQPDRAASLPYPVTVVRDWKQLIASDCEAVIIATPPQWHAPMLEACLEAGKPCLVEKPLCMDAPTATRLDERVSASGVPVLVDHTQLFHPAYRRLKALLREDGQRIRFVLSEGMALGPFRAHSSALWDWGPHDVSLCVDLLGGPPQTVHAFGCGLSPGAAAELLCMRLRFAGDVTAWVHAGRLSPEKRRQLHVFTDRTLYRLDDHSAEPLARAPVDFDDREADGMPRDPAWQAVPCEKRLPMDAFLEYFLDGLSGGDRTAFGTSLACSVVRVLAECERMANV